jgi:hypothetical protein
MQAFSCFKISLCHACGMGKIGKGKKQIGVVLPSSLARHIEGRAKSLGFTSSRYTAMIIEHWSALGHPPVSEPDRLMEVAKKSK